MRNLIEPSLSRSWMRWALTSLLLLGCARHTEPGAPAAPSSVAPSPVGSAAPARSAQPAPPTDLTAETPKPCGELGCKLYPDAAAAFAAVLEDEPLVLALGEAHAQKGAAAVESSTKRFTEQLLPMLEGRASDLVLELWVGNPKCQKQVKQVQKRQEAVTKPQAKENQNEFVTLGNASKAAGIQPHVLNPSCAEYDKILKAGAGDVATMLEMIAQLTTRMLRDILVRNQKDARAGKLVLAYGGALHNDLAPRPGRESWSFGPDVAKLTEQRYVELDLIVPEFIGDDTTWKSFAWVEHYQRLGSDKTVLYNPTPNSYVLVFAKSQTAAPVSE